MNVRDQMLNGRAIERLSKKIEYKKNSVIAQWIAFTIAISVIAGSILYILQEG